MSKTAAAVLAFVCLTLFSIPMSAHSTASQRQCLCRSFLRPTHRHHQQPELSRVEGSSEAFPLTRFPRLGVVRRRQRLLSQRSRESRNTTSSLALVTPPITESGVPSCTPWPAFAASTPAASSTIPLAIDAGGGVDYKLHFKSFSWRMQGDCMRTPLRQRQPERLPRLHRPSLALLKLVPAFLRVPRRFS